MTTITPSTTSHLQPHRASLPVLLAIVLLNVLAAAPPTATPAPGTPAPTRCLPTDNPAFFSIAVQRFNSAGHKLFVVYCAGALPAGWSSGPGANWGTDTGKMYIIYTGPANGTLRLDEGAFCTSSASACSSLARNLGTGKLGDMEGKFGQMSDGTLRIYVNHGTTHAYQLSGKGFSSAEAFLAAAGGFIKVPGQ